MCAVRIECSSSGWLLPCRMVATCFDKCMDKRCDLYSSGIPTFAQLTCC